MRLRSILALILAAALFLGLGCPARAAAEPSFTYELLLTDGSGAQVVPGGRQLAAGDTLNVEITLRRTDISGSYHAWGVEFQLLSNGLRFAGGGESFPGGPAVTSAHYDADPTVDLQVGFAYFDTRKEGVELANVTTVGRWSYTVADPAWSCAVPVHLVYVTDSEEQGVPTTRVTLRLDPGEGRVVGTDVSGDYEEGSRVTLPEAQREGYDFGGWSDGSKTWPSGADYTVAGDVTLTALWTKTADPGPGPGPDPGPGPGPGPGPDPGPGPAPTACRLTLDVNGGVLRGPDVSGSYEAGAVVTLPSALRDGYDFGGWSDGSKTWPAGSYTVAGDAALTARWSPAEEPISVQREKHFNYIQGYPDGSVKPMNPITRAEVSAIFYRLLTEESRARYKSAENAFSDVAAGAWYNTEVSTLAGAGVLQGYEDGCFRPNRPITRAEMATIIARFAALPGEVEISFSDVAGHWAEDNIRKAASNGWLLGYEDGSFRPDRTITRAETVTMINRVLQRRVHREEDLLADMLRFADNADPDAWYYFEIQEAANHHAYTVGDDGWESWTEKLAEIVY